MAYYAVTSESDQLIPLNDLVFSVRIYFIVSDSDRRRAIKFSCKLLQHYKSSSVRNI